MLTEKEIEQFQKLYLKNFGKKISKEEALDMGIKLTNLLINISIHAPVLTEEKN